MQKLSLIFLLLFSFLHSQSQWYDPQKVDHNATTILNLAINKAQSGDLITGVKMINEALKTQPKFVDAYLSLAGMYADMKDYDASVTNFEKAINLDAIYTDYYLLPYSISLAGSGRFNDALNAVNLFLKNPKINERSTKAAMFRKRTYQFAIDYELKYPQKNYIFNPVNIGDSINTEHLEYFPSLTIDGKKLIFTRRIANNEDFYESDLVGGKWSKSRALPGDINSAKFNEGAQNISQDGQWLIFTGCNYPGGFGSCDLYISYLTKKGWSTPQNMGATINTEFWESTPSLSPDKKALYFSSNATGGYGGKDIWVSHRNENGKWETPVNLGPEINTADDESTPFMHADNETLYFNSNGHPGYSDKPDLFMTKKLDNGWAKPVNLGFPINTIDDEGSLIISADGKTAYYSSDRNDTKGGLDIYTFSLPDRLRPLKTLWVKGKVFDKKTTAGLPSTVVLTNVKSGKIVSRLQTDEEGNYLVTLPVGKDYAFNVLRKGYLFFSENYNIPETTTDSDFVADIPLQPIEVNASIVLKNVFFDSKSTELKPESISELDNVVRLMNENPTIKILISGFTDNVGAPPDNLKLSTGRTMSVVNYLVSKEINKTRLSYKGFGESKPIGDNTTEHGKSLNRRTELSVISK